MMSTKSVAAADADMDSVSSFGGSPDKELLQTRPKGRYAWVGNEQVNHENFQRMLEEYRAAKNSEKDMSIKIKQLSAQLARTEEAAKRALVQSDPSAKGGAAQKLLDAERLAYKLREDNAELASKLAREKKRCHDFRVKSEELTRRLNRALQEQRALVERLGRESTKAGARKDSSPCSDENRRRFIRQQEELVALREDNDALKQHLSEGREEAAIEQLQSVVAELRHQVAWYQAKGSQPAADDPNEWLLDEVRHEGQMFLLDATTNKVFSFAPAGQQPRPVGRYAGERVQLGSKGRLEEMLGALDQHLRTAQERLADVWKKIDRDGSGVLERRELQGFLAALLPNCSEKDAEELQRVLDANGDGKVTLDELLATAAQFVQARQELRSGTGSAASGELQRMRTALKGCIPQLKAAVQSELSLQQAATEACKLVPGATAKEKSLLLLKLHMWDVHGLNRIAPLDLLAALELRAPSIRRPKSAASGGPTPMRSTAGSSSPGAPSSSSHAAPAMPTRTYREAWASDSAPAPQAATKPGEDVYLRERVARLEQELQEARKHTTSNRTEAAAAAKLRSELADTKSRLQELQADMLAFDPANFSHLDDDSDALLKQLRGQVSAYRKRYSEGHAELEGLRSMHSRVVEQLEATHSALEAEQKARFRSEDEAGRLKTDLQHLKSLQESLASERNTRMKLEREVLSLQSRALAAPSSALEEVRGLREDLFRAAREKAAAEQREAELRRQLNSLHREGEAVSVAEHQKVQDTLNMAQRRLVSTELELQAAREKLEVYRRTEVPQAMLMDMGDPRSSASPLDASKALRSGNVVDAHLTPDGDKSAEEMRRELLQLRAVYMSEKADLAKVRKLLQHESEVVLEAKACEEAMRCEIEAIRVDMQQQLAALRRQLDSRDEQIRKLEAQLKSAYGGLGKVVRSSQVLRASLGGASQDADLLRDLAPGENLLELTVTDAVLEEKAVSKDAPTFMTLDFFMHETQSTSVAGGTRPAYDTSLQYVVEADRFFLEHLASGALSMELCEARGMDYVVLGSARLPLKLLLEDLRLGTATGASKAVHHVDITGAQGQHLGRVRLMLSFKLPIDQVLLKDFCQALLAHIPDTASIQDQAKIAAKKAAEKPGAAEHVRLQIHRCTALRSQTGSTPAAYAHYRFPGFEHPHDTQVENGSQPEFADECFFPMVRSRELDADFGARSLEVVVFDDNGGDSPLHSIIGVAQLPLSGLAGGHGGREHRLQLRQPITQELTGYIELCLEWRNPLIAAPQSIKGRAHGLEAELSGASSPSSQEQRQQQQQQQQQHQLQQQPQAHQRQNSPNFTSHHTAGSIPAQSLASSITAVLDAATSSQHSYGPQLGQQPGGNYTSQQAQIRPSSGSPPRPTRFAMDSVPRRDVLEITGNSAEFGLMAELG